MLWVGTEKGLFFLNPNENNLVPFDRTLGIAVPLTTAHILYIAPDKYGRVWLCTNNGLYALSKNLEILGRFWTGGKGIEHLPTDAVQHFQEDSNGFFWLATATAGLVRWMPPAVELRFVDSAQGSFRQFDKTNGLPSNTVYGVYADDTNQNIWMSTEAGLACLNKTTLRVLTWVEENGIADKEFNRISHLKSDDGLLYFGGLNGVTVLNPANLLTISGETAPAIQFVGLRLFNAKSGKMIDGLAEVIRSNKLMLTPASPMCQLDFALLDYEDMAQVQYAYKIEGLDSTWHYQREHAITLENLPPRQYLLRLKGCTSTGQWSEELLLEVRVTGSFFSRFGIASAVILITALAMLSFWVLNSRQNQGQKKEIKASQKPTENSPREMDKNEAWLLQLRQTAWDHVGKYDFSLESLAWTMGMSDRHLRRRLKAASGQTLTEFLRDVRLQKAMHLLENHKVNSVAALAAAVGMRDTKYFSRQFKKHFGKLPSDFMINVASSFSND